LPLERWQTNQRCNSGTIKGRASGCAADSHQELPPQAVSSSVPGFYCFTFRMTRESGFETRSLFSFPSPWTPYKKLAVVRDAVSQNLKFFHFAKCRPIRGVCVSLSIRTIRGKQEVGSTAARLRLRANGKLMQPISSNSPPVSSTRIRLPTCP